MDKHMRKTASKRALEEDNSVKLTDMNADCLHSIFKFLELETIFNMCKIGKVFVEPATMIFRRISAGRTAVCDINFLNTVGVSMHSDSLVIPSFDGLKYIGQSLSKLVLDFRDNVRPAAAYVLEYCTQLTELKILFGLNRHFERIEKPFEKLEVLNLSDSNLGPTLCEFSKWFPKLRRLAVVNCDIMGFDEMECKRNMEKKMHSLESLHLDLKVLKCGYAPLKFNCDNVLKRNKHVKRICLDFGCNDEDLRMVSREMVQLETLELRIMASDFERTEPTFRVRSFTTVKKLILKIGTTGEYSHTKCQLAFDVLEELETSYHDMADQWFFFARSNKLKKLKMFSMGDVPNRQLMNKISSTWPTLTEVTMCVDAVSSDEIVEFVRSFRFLQRFDFLKPFPPFKCFDREFNKYVEVQRKLSNEFTVIPCDAVEYRFAIIRKL